MNSIPKFLLGRVDEQNHTFCTVGEVCLQPYGVFTKARAQIKS